MHSDADILTLRDAGGISDPSQTDVLIFVSPSVGVVIIKYKWRRNVAVVNVFEVKMSAVLF